MLGVHIGALVHWSVSASLGVLLLQCIAGVIFATLRMAGRWRVGTLVHRRIDTSAHRHVGMLARARVLACTSIGEERWREGRAHLPLGAKNNDRVHGGNSRALN